MFRKTEVLTFIITLIGILIRPIIYQALEAQP